jgi:hypothetical protein
MRYFLIYFLLPCTVMQALHGCTAQQKKTTGTTATALAVKNGRGNFLSMKVNGVAWVADHEITGIFHPKGYNNAIIIAGSKGLNDKAEQTFNLNLYNAGGTGIFDFAGGNKDNSEVQLANLSNEHYLYGNVLGFSFHAQIIKAGNNPTELEASFEGVLTGNAGDAVKITDGKFYYHE